MMAAAHGLLTLADPVVLAVQLAAERPILTVTSAGVAETPGVFGTVRMPGLSKQSVWLSVECGVSSMYAGIISFSFVFFRSSVMSMVMSHVSNCS